MTSFPLENLVYERDNDGQRFETIRLKSSVKHLSYNYAVCIDRKIYYEARDTR